MKITVMSPPPQRLRFLRKLNPEFTKFGFVNGGSEAEARGQCVEDGLTLSIEAFKGRISKPSMQN